MNRPIRVGCLSHFKELMGGGEMCLLLLMQHLDRKRFQFYLAAPDKSPLAVYAKGLQIPVENIYIPGITESPFIIIQTLYRLKNWIQRENLDLIHANSQRIGVYMALITRLIRTPYIFHDHEIIPLSWGHHLIGRTAARLICVSKEAQKRYASTSYPVECVYNGIDFSTFKHMRDPKDVREEFKITEDSPLLVMTGRMYADKGHIHLIRAMPSVLKKKPETRLIIIDGETSGENNKYKNSLIEMVKYMKLEKNIDFTGFREDIMSLFNAADIIVHPSVKESFGRVVIEGMALRKPVIASRIGGMINIITSGEDGILFEPADSNILADAIISLLNNPTKRRELGEAAYKTVCERFTASQYTDHMSRIYHQVIEYSS